MKSSEVKFSKFNERKKLITSKDLDTCLDVLIDIIVDTYIENLRKRIDESDTLNTSSN